MTYFTGFTDLNVFVVDIGNLTDCSVAIKSDDSNFTGGKSYLSFAIFFSHKLCCNTCGTNELCAFAGVKLDVVDECTYGDCRDGKCVAGFDIGVFTAVDNVVICEAYGSDCVFFLACFVLNECDVCCTVRVVFDTDNCFSTLVECTNEVDFSVFQIGRASCRERVCLSV